jgi:hypothetical protein
MTANLVAPLMNEAQIADPVAASRRLRDNMVKRGAVIRIMRQGEIHRPLADPARQPVAFDDATKTTALSPAAHVLRSGRIHTGRACARRLRSCRAAHPRPAERARGDRALQHPLARPCRPNDCASGFMQKRPKLRDLHNSGAPTGVTTTRRGVYRSITQGGGADREEPATRKGAGVAGSGVTCLGA